MKMQRIENDPFRERWLTLFEGCGCDTYSDRFYLELRKMYSQKHRAYHNFEHIASCLKHFDEIRDHLESPLTVELAIWFHDAIYKIFSSKNEKKSAVYSKFVLGTAGFKPETTDRVYQLIMTTIHPGNPETIDDCYMTDIDISILGSPPEAYRDYENKIRKEYRRIPGFIYYPKRKALLESFLAHDRIYHTDYFCEKYEKKARENITLAIRDLY